MASFKDSGGCFITLLLTSFVLKTLGFPQVQFLDPRLETDSDDGESSGMIWADDADELDPSAYLAAVHDPNEKESMIHYFSRNILRVTNDLVSFAPRTKTDQQLNTQQKLSLLQSLRPEDVKELLSEQSIVIPQIENTTCGYGTLYYRTMDGSCNNFQNPCWGKAEEPYQRWLPPAYANGVDEPRRRSDGFPLPSPRQVYQWVSSQFDQTPDTTYPTLSNLVVVWGQMVAHDLLLTPTVTVKVWDGKDIKNEKPKCCDSPSHPDCIPIVVNYEDAYYSRGHCMNIARSVAYAYSPFSCSPLKLGMPREQMNQITSFLDASLVYGSSEEDMRKLREHGGFGAKLIMDYSSGWSYPTRKNSSCKSGQDFCNKNCFLTGEKRANENPILGAMHTLWAREHNRLVDALRIRAWPEETLFHVVRKIIGAMLQHITYKEYLPLIIGPTLSNLMNLNVPTPSYQYDPSINPTLYNVFVTAAFRYGHSMLSTRHKRAERNMENSPLLSQEFFSMDDFCNPQKDPLADLLSGQLDQKVQKVDCLFTKQVTNHLFAKKVNEKGLDLFSLNIQRGRDHGLPPYNKWREACGLPKARDYSDLKGEIPDYIIDRFKAVYGPGSVDEIDLYVGGIAEFAANNGILGPTFTCIVANQFKNLKFGDRFWYENINNPGAFTPGQINSIQKTTLASLLCRNTDVREIQPLAFLLESNQNRKLPCDFIMQETDLDLNLWP